MIDENNVELKVGNVVALPELYWEHGSPHAKFTYFEVKVINTEDKLHYAAGPLISSPDGHYIPNFTVKIDPANRFLIVRDKYTEEIL